MNHYSSLTDETLVKRYEHGDNPAFEELLFRHKERVFGYIYNVVRSRDMADDLFQETFIKVITTIKQGRYQESGKFLAWVLRIAHNLTIDHFRKGANDMTISNDDSPIDLFNNAGLCEESKQDTICQEDTLKDIATIMEMLPQNQREIVYMRYYQEMSFKEIADAKEISINTALGRMRYAILNMRKMAADKELLNDFSEMIA